MGTDFFAVTALPRLRCLGLEEELGLPFAGWNSEAKVLEFIYFLSLLALSQILQAVLGNDSFRGALCPELKVSFIVS